MAQRVETSAIAGVLLAAALAGCGAESGQVRLEERPSEIWTPGRRLDLGSAEAAAALGSGWWPQAEADARGGFRWAIGKNARLSLALPADAGAIELDLDAPGLGAGPAQRLVFRLDGARLGEAELLAEPRRVRLELPGALRAGLHELSFEASRVLAPAGPGTEQRALAFRARTLEVEAGELPGGPGVSAPEAAGPVKLPPGAAWSIPLLPEPGSVLRLGIWPAGIGFGRLRITWEDASGRTGLGEASAWSRVLSRRLDLGLPAGRPGRLLLESAGRGSIAVEGAVLSPAPPAPAAAAGPIGPRPRNLVIYLFDALRADVLGAYGMPRPVSPHVDRLARNGRVVRRLIGHSAWTRPAVATLFTGLLPWSHGAQRRDDGIPSEAETLAELLAEEGLFTAAVVGNANASAAFGFAQGFQSFVEGYTLEDVLARHPENPKLRSDDLSVQAEHSLDLAGQRPFFLFLHSVDPHFPYVPPEPVAGFEAGEAPGSPQDAERRLYRACVRSNDEQIGRLLGMLEERGLLESTLVVLVSDHGEEFWDHGGTLHGHSLYEEITRIPLLLSGPGVEPGIEPLPLLMADLAPSLLRSMGFLEPHSQRALRFDGRPLELRAATPPGPAVTIPGQELLDSRVLGALESGHFKLTRNRKRLQLFDLARDPAEQRNLALQDPWLLRWLEAELEVQTRPQRLLPALRIEARGLDQRIEAELKALGYLE